MIAFLGWLVVFAIVTEFGVRMPVIGLPIAIWIAFYNPFFWLIPIIALIAFVFAYADLKRKRIL